MAPSKKSKAQSFPSKVQSKSKAKSSPAIVVKKSRSSRATKQSFQIVPTKNDAVFGVSFVAVADSLV